MAKILMDLNPNKTFGKPPHKFTHYEIVEIDMEKNRPSRLHFIRIKDERIPDITLPSMVGDSLEELAERYVACRKYVQEEYSERIKHFLPIKYCETHIIPYDIGLDSYFALNQKEVDKFFKIVSKLIKNTNDEVYGKPEVKERPKFDIKKLIGIKT
ncbi:hypothetical protein ACFL1H_06390 [Nanoarchaeota archaeon]